MQRSSLIFIVAFGLSFGFLSGILSMVPAFVYASTPPAWGCCEPGNLSTNDASCFAAVDVQQGNPYNQNQFQTMCSALNGAIVNAGTRTTCQGLDAASQNCEMGCCFATTNYPNSYTYNIDPASPLHITRYACGQKLPQGDFSFRSIPTGETRPCYEQAANIVPPGETTTVDVTGSVQNASGQLVGVSVFILAHQEIRNVTVAGGRFTLQNVPLEGDGTQYIMVDAACLYGAKVTVTSPMSPLSPINVVCPVNVCKTGTPTVSTPEPVTDAASLTMSVEIDNACHIVDHYNIDRCEDGNETSCITIKTGTMSSTDDKFDDVITDTGLKPGTKYCYRATAISLAGIPTPSAITDATCGTTGDTACLGRASGAPAQWCGTDPQTGKSAVLSCDATNKLSAATCPDGQRCSAVQGVACTPAPPCEQCNGLLGLFGKLTLTIPWIQGTDVKCDMASASFAQFCYKDSELPKQLSTGQETQSTPVAIDAFTACPLAPSCGAYKNNASCMMNPCQAADGPCDWRVLDPELGRGLCVNKTRPACASCADALGGDCTATACGNISADCYFQTQRNGISDTIITSLPRCLYKDDMACRYYDTKTDCVGSSAGADARFDIAYSAQGVRKGSNALLSQSKDKLGFGVCSWTDLGVSPHCYKNADARVSDPQNPDDDCIESGVFVSLPWCVEDRTPPTTTLMLARPAAYTDIEARDLPMQVNDDHWSAADIITLGCFWNATNDCYPSQALRPDPLPQWAIDRGIQPVDYPAAGNYLLRYYSIDHSENAEVMRNVSVTIKDSGLPALNQVAIEQNR